MSLATAIASPSIELLTWDVTRYHAAARAGLLGDQRLELLEGIIAVVPNPDQFHEWIIRQVIKFLAEALGDAALVDKGQPVRLSKTSEPVPDIVVLKPRAHEYKRLRPTPEDAYLIIEIGNSMPERDTELKRGIYARAAIQEYWVFEHLEAHELRVFRDIDNGDYQTDVVWTKDVIAVQALPDIKLDAEQLRALMND
ncbi:MAG: Uma2 family endonuclease [Cyanobacteria bacterium J06607_17]